MAVPPDLPLLGRRLRGVSEDVVGELARVALGRAAVDGAIEPAEIQAIEGQVVADRVGRPPSFGGAGGAIHDRVASKMRVVLMGTGRPILPRCDRSHSLGSRARRIRAPWLQAAIGLWDR